MRCPYCLVVELTPTHVCEPMPKDVRPVVARPALAGSPAEPHEIGGDRLRQMLKLWLVTQNVTQKEFAATIGCNQSGVCRFLSGEGFLNGPMMARIIAWMVE